MTQPTYDDLIDPSDIQLIQNLVNNHGITLKEKLERLRKQVKPEGPYKKKVMEQFIQVYWGEQFLLCII